MKYGWMDGWMDRLNDELEGSLRITKNDSRSLRRRRVGVATDRDSEHHVPDIRSEVQKRPES